MNLANIPDDVYEIPISYALSFLRYPERGGWVLLVDDDNLLVSLSELEGIVKGLRELNGLGP